MLMAMATRWEYRVKFIRIPKNEATAVVTSELNEVGDDGWELVNIVEVGTILMAVFKRPLPQSGDIPPAR
jgi:hypothetical protein